MNQSLVKKANLMMKLALTVFLLVFVTFACQDNTFDRNDPKDHTIEEAKEAYKEAEMRLNSKFSGQYSLSPKWANSEFKQSEADLTELYVPYGRDSKTGNTLELLFINKQGEFLESQVIERKPSKEYFIKNGFKENNGTFEGHMNFYSLSGIFKVGGIFEKGLFVDRYIPVEELAELGNRAQTARTTDEAIDLNVVTVIGHRPSEPNTYVWINIPSYAYNPNGGTWNGVNYGSGTGGGSGGGSSSGGGLKEIKDSLVTSCFKNVLAQMVSGTNYRNEVKTILNNFSTSPDVIVTFREANLNNPSLDGQATGKTITLNTGALAYASKEYIAATIMHETLHAYLNGPGFTEIEHTIMAARYVYPMRDALVQMFPGLDSNYAEALAWGGLQGTSAWTLVGNYSQQNYLAINVLFKNLNNAVSGKKGSYCN